MYQIAAGLSESTRSTLLTYSRSQLHLVLWGDLSSGGWLSALVSISLGLGGSSLMYHLFW